ncbi:hypothetical protein [Novosphingobium album (ex Hu et al. 2023)]|uniref:Uncharacterized protein n=1 Tax=Novosphingobium album (ex Hu et al. 2023) TaxID=2930093 RepID=A0ABT0B7K2_9SPHN|nr:hypothetical protein [Novosphingobium album (ex Hu et al. 2023)]MCJ2181040.1 hypothetical protein [Novosphingobium album (ex Hu et al. 2023)]
MSRAMNLALTEEDVIAACAKSAVSVSCTETLLSGGTHLVCTTGEGAEEMRSKLKKHIIEGDVRRQAFYRPKNRW